MENSNIAKSQVVLTGDRPTGKLHLGHYVGTLKNRVKLQSEYDEVFIMVANLQALTDNFDNPQKVHDSVFEVVAGYLACGLSPDKVNIFLQSDIPQIPELTLLFMNLISLAKLKRNPTVKTEMNEKGMGDTVPIGFLSYPVSQAADIMFCGGTLVPVGEDQLPVLEDANDIREKFNRIYGHVFDEIKPILSNAPRLVGIDGSAKASKSLGNAIFLNESAEELERKVMAMYTDPGHIHVSDPGKVEGNVVFEYLDIFDNRKEELAELKEKYRAGGLGDVVLKKRLLEVLENLIAPMREKYDEVLNDTDYILGILKRGGEVAREKGEKTMAKVRSVVRLAF